MGSLFVAMVQVDREERIGPDGIRRTDDGLQHTLIRVGPRSLADLYDEGRPGIHVAAEEPHGLLKVIDVIGAQGVVPIGVLEEDAGWNDHDKLSLSHPALPGTVLM